MIDNSFLLEMPYLSTNDVLLRPQHGLLKSRKEAVVNTPFIYNSPMDTVASYDLALEMLASNQCFVTCRFDTNQNKIKYLNNFAEQENFWFSVGTSKEDYELINAWWYSTYRNCSKAPPKINISVDVAHGDTFHLLKVYKMYKSQPWCKYLMSGTIATAESAERLYLNGCTHIRVGIGPGSACSTRIVTGCGIPNLSAVHEVYDYLNSVNKNIKIIADGGIKNSGDIAKYLSAGAHAVMIGNLLSLTEESSGWKVNPLYYYLNLISFGYLFKNYKYKYYRGQASAEFQIDKRGKISGTPEGVQGKKSYPQYTFHEFDLNIKQSLQSTISYLGLNNIESINPKNVQLIRITNNGFSESTPHLLSS